MRQDTLQGTPEERAMGFEPVAGGGDTTSAGVMLVAAYLVFWVLLVGFIWLSWRKLGKMEARVAGLERMLGPTDGGQS